jgi:hypothetical protein
MRRLSFLRTVAAIVSLSVASLGFIHVAHAGIIGTPQVVQSAEHTPRSRNYRPSSLPSR